MGININYFKLFLQLAAHRFTYRSEGRQVYLVQGDSLHKCLINGLVLLFGKNQTPREGIFILNVRDVSVVA